MNKYKYLSLLQISNYVKNSIYSLAEFLYIEVASDEDRWVGMDDQKRSSLNDKRAMVQRLILKGPLLTMVQAWHSETIRSRAFLMPGFDHTGTAGPCTTKALNITIPQR